MPQQEFNVTICAISRALPVRGTRLYLEFLLSEAAENTSSSLCSTGREDLGMSPAGMEERREWPTLPFHPIPQAHTNSFPLSKTPLRDGFITWVFGPSNIPLCKYRFFYKYDGNTCLSSSGPTHRPAWQSKIGITAHNLCQVSLKEGCCQTECFSLAIQNKNLHFCLFVPIKHIYINIYSTSCMHLFKAWLLPSLLVSGKRIESKVLAGSMEWEKIGIFWLQLLFGADLSVQVQVRNTIFKFLLAWCVKVMGWEVLYSNSAL